MRKTQKQSRNRKTSLHTTKIFTFSGRLPIEGAERLDQQLKLARIYHNKLLEIELKRRTDLRAAMCAWSPEIAKGEAAARALTEAIEAERAVINAAKAAARSNKVNVDESQRKIDGLKAARAKIRQGLTPFKIAYFNTPEMKAQRAALRTKKDDLLRLSRELGQLRAEHPEDKAQIKKLSEARKAVRHAHRAAAENPTSVARLVARAEASAGGLYWGSYLLVEQAIEAACENTADPEFKHWDGSGRVGVQLQGGLTVAKAMAGQDTRLRILHTPTANGSKCGALMHQLWLRVGSTESGGPIWAAFPFRMHRPLPADGVIKWAWAHRTYKGRWVNWDLQIVVEAPSFTADLKTPVLYGVVAVDLGWRKRERLGGDGRQAIRVGYWCNDQGAHGQLVMPAELKERLQYAEKLRSTQDTNFEAAKAVMLAWLETHHLPESLAPLAQGLAQWRSAKRLGHLINEWAKLLTVQGITLCPTSKEGDISTVLASWWEQHQHDEALEILSALSAWWKQHRHLYDWESCQRDRVLNARKGVYRNISAQFTRQYAAVVIEDFDMRDVVELQLPESTKRDAPKAARHNRVLAAPSEFRLALISAAPSNGCLALKAPCARTTLDCHICHAKEEWDTAPEVMHTCPNGHTWDQDYNAARNLLAKYASGDVVPVKSPSVPKRDEAKKASRSQTAGQTSEKKGLSEDTITIPVHWIWPS